MVKSVGDVTASVLRVSRVHSWSYSAQAWGDYSKQLMTESQAEHHNHSADNFCIGSPNGTVIIVEKST